MIREKRMRSRIFLLFAAAAGIGCILEAAAGPTPTPQVIVVPGDGTTSSTPSPTLESMLALTPTWTITAGPTSTTTTAPVTMTAGQDLSCVKGPHWILYEWVAGIAEGEVVTLLARSTADWPDYFYARKSNGTECWAFGASSTISGNAAGLPVREAPPLPEVVYQIENKTGLAVSKVFIRGKNEGVWGVNRLGTGMILPGQTANIALTAGFYDVRILENKREEVLYEEHDRAIGPDPGYRYTSLYVEVNLFVYNDFPINICGLSYRATGEAAWRVLHSIEEGVLVPGAGVSVKIVVGMYDFRFTKCDGTASNASGISILPSATRFPE